MYELSLILSKDTGQEAGGSRQAMVTVEIDVGVRRESIFVKQKKQKRLWTRVRFNMCEIKGNF